MKTFKIQYGDLVFDGQNNLVMVEGKDEEVQSIERILTTNQGEWFLNIAHGLNYNEIQGKGKDIESIKLAIAEAIYQDDRVEDIEFLQVEVDRQNRKLNVDFKVRTNTKNLIEGIEVMDVG